MSLRDDLGWDDRWKAYLAAASAESGAALRPARVVAGHRGAIEVTEPEDVTGTVPEPISVSLDTPGHATDAPDWPPVVGDWVALDQSATVLLAVLPRRTFLERPSTSGRSVGQPIAANVDIVMVVEPMEPAPSAGRVERFTALARSCGAQAWLVLTKTDLVAPLLVQEACDSLGRFTDEVISCSTEDSASFQALRDLLPGGTTAVLVGRSGAGKSTLTNMLLGTEIATQAVRASDSKGRHTTTGRQLVARRGVSVIDTPGVRALAATTDEEAIDDTFQDISLTAASCQYADCQHRREPGCAVLAAVEDGTLDGDRLERYQRMLRESARLSLRQDARSAREQDRRATKGNSRGRRGTMRLKGRL